MSENENNSEIIELTKYLKANLLLQIRNLPENENSEEKIEFILYRAGFSRNEIAEMLGKKYETVKKTIQLMKPESKPSKLEGKDAINENQEEIK